MTEATPTPNNSNSNSDAFSKGLLNLLKPVVVECDTRMQAVFTSQTQLSDQIDELSAGNRSDKISKGKSHTIFFKILLNGIADIIQS